MTDPRKLKVGDPVMVDCTGLGLALCPSCDNVGLAVPDGFCVHCQAPASSLIFDPAPLTIDRPEDSDV